MTHTKSYEIRFNTTDLATLETFLERVTKAARDGHLDQGACEIQAVVNLELMNDTQDVQPLEDFIERESRIGGLGFDVIRT